MNYATRYPRFWLFYFWLSVLACGAGYVIAMLDAIVGKASASDLVSLALSTAALWPLYGYARQRAIAPRLLWSCLLGVFVVGSVLTAGILLFMLASTGKLHLLLVLLGSALLVTPYFLALFQYVHRSPHIWRSAV